MSLGKFSTVDEVYCKGQRIARAYSGGAKVYERQVKIADFYGTGLGKVTTHLDPAKAVMSGANVASIPNLAGTGSAVAGGREITRPAKLMVFPAGFSWIELPSAIDTSGSRLFFVLQRPDTVSRRIASMEVGVAADANDDRMLVIYGGVTMPDGSAGARIRQATGFPSDGYVGPIPATTALAVYEVQVVNDVMTVRYNGGQEVSGPVSSNARGSFLLTRLFAGQMASANNWVGPVGDFIQVSTDGTHQTTFDAIRVRLKAKHGIV